jgi:TetR/AcrR family transcriptional repressor of mexJK operon
MTDASPPIRRREAARLERRQAIIETAAQSFLADGYAGTTMSGIAERLGGSKGTLWSYFKSKEALFAAFLDASTTDFRSDLVPLLEGPGEMTAILEVFISRFIEKLAGVESISLYRLVIGEGGRFPEIARLYYDRAQGATEHLLAAFLESRIVAGDLRPASALEAARLLILLCADVGRRDLLPDEGARPATRIEIVRLLDQFMAVYGVRRTPH